MGQDNETTDERSLTVTGFRATPTSARVEVQLSEARHLEVVAEPTLNVSCWNDFGPSAPCLVKIVIKNNFVSPSEQDRQNYTSHTFKRSLILGFLEARSKAPRELRSVQMLDTLCRLDCWARSKSTEGSPKHSLEQ